MNMTRQKLKLTSAQIIILGFAAVILIGSLLLMLPFATKGPGNATFLDALFTATSAVCVTGLIVQDTATYWTVFGQLVILILIQIGGLGVVTVASAITMKSGKKISLMQRSTMQESISAQQVGGIVRLTVFILKMTLIIEMTGAICLATVFIPQFGFVKGCWYSLFHSISAFCNAGFDLMGIRAPYSSLTSFSDDVVVNLTIMLLIIIGGIGFLTWEDMINKKLDIKKYRMQSKVILTVSAVLIAAPAIYFYFFEFAGMTGKERILNALFQSVTTRTAGFNTADLTKMTETGILLMSILMMIGGSPGSTAGGMKTTTVAVLIGNMISVFRRREHAHFYGRRVAEETVRNAAAILAMYLTLCLGGAMIISAVEKLPMMTCLFETASAVGTVGLTLGITPELGVISRLILILLMYLGRVGGLTVIFATVSGIRAGGAKYPQEKITVG
ncbi:MAG: Trk family potassium uptake protein [Lachnospiraceae bacterium]|nr:Trk family potassium uptake protein [Lachnospiraceae bacterium]